MKGAHFRIVLSWSLVVLAFGCGGSTTVAPTPVTPSTPSTIADFAYVLTGYAVSMYTVNSSTGAFTATTPAVVNTGYAPPQQGAEQMVADPLGRFAYVANLVSNGSDQATISMYTINPSTGVLTPTTPATVPTGFFPQGIAIDPLGRFVYTANTDDSTVSMFTINQTTGVLTATTPASVSTLVPGEPLSQPSFLTVDPTGKFVYVTALLSQGAAVFMYAINQTNGLLTPTSPATVSTGGIPFQVAVAPSGKYVYVVNNWSSGSSTDAPGVSQYTVDSTTGVLTANTPPGAWAGNGPTAVAVDPTSKYAYVVNGRDNTVSMFRIDQTTGNLLPNGTVATGADPFRIDFDPTGRFAYVTNEQSAASIYTVASDGTLTAVGTTGPTTGAFSIAITAVPKGSTE
jgi:DNA-binding beta-propeller fold protein YncE